MTDLPALKAALAAASPAPWRTCGANAGMCQCGLVWDASSEWPVAHAGQVDGEVVRPQERVPEDARLIVALRNAAPDLIAELERLREAVQAADYLADYMDIDIQNDAWGALARYRAARGRT